MLNIVYKRITIRGFLVSDYVNVFAQFLAKTLDYLRAGKLKVIEDISLGVESIPSAFVELFNGANIGKKIVYIGSGLPRHKFAMTLDPCGIACLLSQDLNVAHPLIWHYAKRPSLDN
ncbi:NADPH-dependent oxidoreductase 2-alkenal reductase, partial [Mucuna pruriens]